MLDVWISLNDFFFIPMFYWSDIKFESKLIVKWFKINYIKCKTIARTTCNFSDGNGENGFGTVQGTLSITEYRDCPDNAFETVYSGKLSGSSTNFVQGLHGLHVHQGYELSSCGALGGHFTVNPSAIHGRPFWEEPER